MQKLPNDMNYQGLNFFVRPKAAHIEPYLDTGIQFWANSSAASTVSILGNAAILLGGLYLLSRSDEVSYNLLLAL